MKKVQTFTFMIVCLAFYLVPGRTMADLAPVVGVNLFGGAERGVKAKPRTEGSSVGEAGGMGGIQGFGLYPLSSQFGLQGNLLYQAGGTHNYRLGVGGGPVYSYGSGQFGLFVDYEYRRTPLAEVRPNLVGNRDRNGQYNNFIFLRGVWAHFFEQFDLVLSYTQPVHHTQYSSAIEFDNGCAFRVKDLSINELKGLIRYYPTRNIELDAGMLVNSFAGPDRNLSGTGVGGVFGASFSVTENIVLNLFQGQADSRSRYRVTSGVQFFWTPGSGKEQERETKAIARSTAGLGSGATTSPT